ncbi:MAG: Co2+/Mg2+ efflux protein ApaG [Thiomonas sp.]|jgi:ApaG protein
MSAYQFSVSVIPQYLPEQSDPDRQVYAYSYTVTVINTGRVAAQLISRHWIITDGTGKVQEVRGLGVVGQQPFLKPGEAFEYTSWAQLGTPTGSMRGSYFCVAEDGTRFEALIPEFALVQPRSLH